nr:MAG TPA: hypothetical protein [Caudoviricetes sp.]
MQKEGAHAGSVERHYKNGATVRFLKGEPPKEQEKEEEALTEQEQAILETAINVDYLVCMKELEI